MQEYNSTDQHIHLLCQPIAKLNRTYVTKKEDDSHTNLFFDSVNNRIFGRWVETNQGFVVLALNLETQEYEWLTKSLHQISTHNVVGKTIEEIEIDTEQLLDSKGQSIAGFRKPLHFDIPDYSFKEEPFKPFNKVGLSEWKEYRRLANSMCSSVLGMLQADGEARIWPHHFDTGIYIEQTSSLGIGYGLATFDGMLDSAYFYVSGYGLNDAAIDYNKLEQPSFGKWLTEDWKGAALEIKKLQGLSLLEKVNIVEKFSATAIQQLMISQGIH